MEPKRELSSVDLAALVTELRGYAGAKVDKAYLYGDDLLRLRMRDFDRGRVELFVEVGDVKRAHVVDPTHVPDAPGRPPNFAMMLRNRIQGADFVDVEQYEYDRILTFTFERGDETTRIVAELFGQGNVAVLDGTGKVVQCLDTVRLKSRTVAPGAQYEYPASRLNPLTVSRDEFGRRMADSDTDLVRTLATQFNLGGLYAEELCTRAGVEKTRAIADADEADYDALYDALQGLASDLKEGGFEPRVYSQVDEDDGSDGHDESDDRGGPPGRVVDATPFRLAEREGAGLVATTYDTFTEAVDDYFHHLDRSGDDDGGGEAGDDGPDFEERIAKHERIIAQQEGAIEGFDERADAERAKAESLYANYDLVDDVLKTVQAARDDDRPWDEIEERLAEGRERGIPAAEAVVGVDGAEGTVTVEIQGVEVELDASTGVEKNADRLYTEAKRIQEKKEGALAAIEDTREELAAIERERDAWEARDEDDESEEDDEAREVDWLARSSVPIRVDEQWYERFRWFHTSDGFLVVGGRNADQNEELVKKYLDGHDLFYHTQAHGGPVTVLKATGPSEPARDVDVPARSREEAAQFAVAYSSVWKEGRGADDAYEVTPDQVSKTPESGEYLEKGGFAIRGERTYYRDLPARVAVGVACEPETRVLGGPPSAIDSQVATSVELEPGRYAVDDMAKLLYREFRERFADQSFVRKVASPDRIAEFLPPGGSRRVDD